MTITRPSISAEVPKQFSDFTARNTELRGNDFDAHATEFTNATSHRDRMTLSINFPTRDGLPAIFGAVTNGSISIDIGDVTVWVPRGSEQALTDALAAAVEEQNRDTGECVVFLTTPKEVVKNLLSDSPDILAAEKWQDDMEARA